MPSSSAASFTVDPAAPVGFADVVVDDWLGGEYALPELPPELELDFLLLPQPATAITSGTATARTVHLRMRCAPFRLL